MTFLDSVIGRENTKKAYRSLFKTRIEPDIPEEKAPGFQQKQLEALVRKWLNAGLKPNTVKALIRLTARYVKWAGGEELQTAQLINSVSRLEQKKPVNTLTKNQLNRLLDSLEDEHTTLYLVVLFAAHAGLRRGEVFGLQWADIQGKQIEVVRSYDGPTKNGRPKGIPKSARVKEAIQKYLSEPKEPDTFLFKRFDPNPPLRKHLKRLGLPPRHFHDLRHTFATIGLDNQTNPKHMQQWLGHSSLKTTIDIYWNSMPSDEIDFLD